jgi:hypothetical protein
MFITHTSTACCSYKLMICNTGTNDEHQNISFTEYTNALESFLSSLKETYTHTVRRIGIIVSLDSFYTIMGCFLTSFSQNPFGEFTKTPSRGSYARHGFYEPDLEHLIGTWNTSKFFDEDDEDHIYTPVTFIQTAEWLKGELTMDGTHPTVAGHQAIGEKLAKWLLDNDWLKPSG